MVDVFMLHKVLDKIKEIINIEQFDDTKLLIDTDGKLLDDIILKNVVILITCVIRDNCKFYAEIFFEEALLA